MHDIVAGGDENLLGDDGATPGETGGARKTMRNSNVQIKEYGHMRATQAY